jgi:hypothetical protein
MLPCLQKVFKTISRRDEIWNGLFGEGRRPFNGRDPLLMRILPLLVELKAEKAVIMPELSETDESVPYFKKCYYFNVRFNVIPQLCIERPRGASF